MCMLFYLICVLDAQQSNWSASGPQELEFWMVVSHYVDAMN